MYATMKNVKNTFFSQPLPLVDKAQVKNYNLNVTEVWGSDFKNAFPGIFNFTVGILVDAGNTVAPRLILTQLTFQNRLTLIFNLTYTEFL